MSVRSTEYMSTPIITRFKLAAAAFVVGAAITAAAPAFAAPVTFNFLTSGGNNLGNSYGNTRVYTSGALTLTVTSWSTTGNGGALQSSQTGWYNGYGLGVCNRNEGTGCGNPEHQLDNSNARDFILFRLSATVDPTTVSINPYGSYDRDATYFVGNSANANLTNFVLTNLSLGLVGYDDFSSVSENARNVGILGGLGNTLLFGVGAIDNNYNTPIDSSTDRFKIQSLTVDYTPGPQGNGDPVPVPATLSLFAAALLGLRTLAGHRRG